MRKWLLASAALLWATSASAQPAPWPGQCPAGTLPTAIGCQPAAATPVPTDLVLGWQTGQTPSTRSMQLQQIINENIRQSRASLQGQGYFYAADFGVKADGVSSDDVALKAAIDACSAKGGRVFLPAGRILLNGTGAATINLKNCLIEGAGPLAGYQGDNASMGTTFLLTSTTVQPFTITSDWGMEKVSFYWPNQITGITVYPWLMAPPTDVTVTAHWYIDHVTIVNAYRGIKAAGGSFSLSNSFMYATNIMLETETIGDGFLVNNIHFTPGPWFTLTNFAATSAIDEVTKHNIIFHAVGGGSVPAFNASISNVGGFAWRYGFLVESGVRVGITKIDWYLDGTATAVEVRPGGGWGPGVSMSGGVICHHVDFSNSNNIGNAPCFNFPANTPSDGGGNSFDLRDFQASASGTFILSDDTQISLTNVSATVGAVNDGGDYYAVHALSNSGGMVIVSNKSRFSGKPGDVHRHGFKSDVILSRLIVQDNLFEYLNEAIDAPAAGGTTLITGNWSVGTTGPKDIVAANMMSSHKPVMHRSNYWEKPPISLASNCGTGCHVDNGAFNGFIAVGSTIPTTTGDLQLPWVPMGNGGGLCRFYVNGLALPVSGQLDGATQGLWHWNTGGTDIHNAQLFYSCPGAE